ncbi:MAG: RNA polymerase factor sigma-54 [Planctomycetaceae bacterium]|nr:RNA polymerase factor sigma-54 [Planctomycetaceae bacterium]
MHLGISQQMKMSQQMKLAPRMIQSMEILQLPVMALQERIEQELSENVTLEDLTRDPDSISDTEVETELQKARDDATDNGSEKEMVSDQNNESDFERLLEMSSEWPEDNVSAGSRPSSNRIGDDMDRQHDLMSNMTARPQSLHEYLLEQFGFFSCSKEVRHFGEYLIQNLDANGRLQSSLPEIVQVYGRPIQMEQAEEALQLIRQLDPAGVGARDVKDCLLLQLDSDRLSSEDQIRCRDVLRVLISEHLEDIARNRLPVIERRTGYSIETIKHAIEALQHLDPYPGRNFQAHAAQNVTADLSVERQDDGTYQIRMDDEYTPSLRISPYYVKQLRNNPDQQTKDYIRRKIESARWLIESIEQRNNTLRRVAQSIVDRQAAFLEHGPERIVPLKMQEIADEVGVHVTTVSRAVDDKWIQTPRGLFPLKRFFGGGTQTAEGEEVAWDIIRLKLQKIVDEEDKQKPLSDDALVAALAEMGYQLARRTVTKYRKTMGIPSSRERREF